jgi:hypothetical protein
MIAVVGSVPCANALVSYDPWIPLKISWQLPRLDQPLYLRVSGEAGGELELKVDPDSGALLAVIVITAPPEGEPLIELPAAVDPNGRTPVLDKAQWEWKETPDRVEPINRVATTRARLGLARQGDVHTLVFSDEAVAEYVSCGSVRVGVAADGALVNVVAFGAVDSQEDHSSCGRGTPDESR